MESSFKITQGLVFLISAPTGGTKTLTAFLSILNHLVILAENNELKEKVYAVYTSPLKALSNDIHKNLIEPLDEINELAEKKGIKLQKIRTFRFAQSAALNFTQ